MPVLEQPSDVLQRFCHGDLDAFEAMFHQHQGEVHGWIVRIVRDPTAAEDLTVETFWRIYCARARFDPKRGFGPWARRIATNAALDHLRMTRPEQAAPDDLASPQLSDPGVSEDLRRKTARAFRRLPAETSGYGHAGTDRRATLQGNRRGAGHFHGRRQGARLPRPPPSPKRTEATRSRPWNEHDREQIKQLLKNSLPPISARVGTGLRRDLWPAMLKRLAASPPRCRGLTGLSVAVVTWLAFFPGAIPVLVYHL